MDENHSRLGLQCADLCYLILIIISIPANSGWVERVYSYLEKVCQKKRSRMCIGNLKEPGYSKIKAKKGNFDYGKEIEILSG